MHMHQLSWRKPAQHEPKGRTDEHEAQGLLGPAQAAQVAPANGQLRVQQQLLQRLVVRQQAALQRRLCPIARFVRPRFTRIQHTLCTSSGRHARFGL